MGILDFGIKKISKKADEINIDFNNIASSKVVDVITELSGVNQKITRRIVDNVIVFTSASGGTGASTIASNVAFRSYEKGFKVILIDLNIMCPIQHTFLGIRQELEKPDLASYILGKNKLSECIEINKNVNLMYANNRTLADELNCNESTSVTNFEDMINNLRSYYDIVFIDCPCRIDNMLNNTAMYMADSIYIVWDEGIGSIINTEKYRRNMALSGIDAFTKMRVIMNKRTNVSFSTYPFEKLNIELVEVLPFDVDIIENSLRGKIFCESGDTHSKNAIEFAKKINSLTDKIFKIGGYIEKQSKGKTREAGSGLASADALGDNTAGIKVEG